MLDHLYALVNRVSAAGCLAGGWSGSEYVDDGPPLCASWAEALRGKMGLADRCYIFGGHACGWVAETGGQTALVNSGRIERPGQA